MQYRSGLVPVESWSRGAMLSETQQARCAEMAFASWSDQGSEWVSTVDAANLHVKTGVFAVDSLSATLQERSCLPSLEVRNAELLRLAAKHHCSLGSSECCQQMPHWSWWSATSAVGWLDLRWPSGQPVQPLRSSVAYAPVPAGSRLSGVQSATCHQEPVISLAAPRFSFPYLTS